METKGYFSLIQFSPNLARHEGINIGVVVYSAADQRLAVRMLQSHARIKQVYGKQDWSFINYSKDALRHRLYREVFASKDELQDFASRRANAIQLTPLSPVAIRDLETDTTHLFKDLVQTGKKERRKRIDKMFADRLLAAGVSGLVEKSVQINLPYFNEPLRAGYAYQNGRYNLLVPISLSSEPKSVLSKIGEKALEGDLLYKNPDPTRGDLCLNVIAKFADRLADQSRAFIEQTLKEHHVKLYNLDHLEPLVDDIREAAAAHGV